MLMFRRTRANKYCKSFDVSCANSRHNIFNTLLNGCEWCSSHFDIGAVFVKACIKQASCKQIFLLQKLSPCYQNDAIAHVASLRFSCTFQHKCGCCGTDAKIHKPDAVLSNDRIGCSLPKTAKMKQNFSGCKRSNHFGYVPHETILHFHRDLICLI